jgi:hypothetical protein
MSDKETNDLDILFPDILKPTKFTAGDKKRYEITYFIPAGVSLISTKPDTEDPSGLKTQLKVLECFLKRQHSHMDSDWIEKNISLQVQNAIYLKLVSELAKSNKMLGEEQETAKP